MGDQTSSEFITPPLHYSTTPTADWRAWLRAPTRRVVAWAADRPERRLLSSNESGRFCLYAWEEGEPPRLLPPAAKAGYTWLSPDGDTLVFVQDADDSEVGQLVRVPWEGGALEPAAPG